MAERTFSLLNFNDIQSPTNFSVSVYLKNRFVKRSGTVPSLYLNDSMK